MNLSQLDLKEMYDWPQGLQIVMLILLFTLVVLFGYLFDLGHKYNEIESARVYELDLKNSFKKTLEEQIKAHGEVNLIPRLESQLKNWQTQLTATADMPILLDTILKMGRDSSLTINEFSPGAEVRGGSVIKIPVTVRLNGTYDQIGTFLSNIASYKSLIAIKNLVINKPEELNMQGSSTPAEADAGSEQTSANPATKNDSTNAILNAELTLEIYKR